MTEPNKISAEDIIDSWGASAHMSTAIEHLFDACNTSFITTQIQSMEAAIEAVKKGAERLKGNKEKQDAAGKSVKFLRAEIHRLRKKLQRGVKHETAADRTKKPTLLDKEIKRIHKGVKKEKKATKKEAKKEKKQNVIGRDKLVTNTVSFAEGILGKPLTTSRKSLEDAAQRMSVVTPKLEEANKKLVKALVDGAIKAGAKADEIMKSTAKASEVMKKLEKEKKSSKKKPASKKGKK